MTSPSTTSSPTPDEARAALAAADQAATATATSRGVQTAAILAGGLTFIAPLVGAGGWIRTHEPAWMVGGLAIGGIVLLATILLARRPMRFDRGFRNNYLVSVLVNAVLYTVYLMLLTHGDTPRWSRILMMGALLLIAPVITATTFHFGKGTQDRAAR